MTSQYWNEAQASANQQFRDDFPERTLSGKTVMVAGGSGGLGAAAVALLAREGAHLIVGYGANRQRARALRRSIESSFHCSISLVAGDIALPEVRRAHGGRRKDRNAARRSRHLSGRCCARRARRLEW